MARDKSNNACGTISLCFPRLNRPAPWDTCPLCFRIGCLDKMMVMRRTVMLRGSVRTVLKKKILEQGVGLGDPSPPVHPSVASQE